MSEPSEGTFIWDPLPTSLLEAGRISIFKDRPQTFLFEKVPIYGSLEDQKDAFSLGMPQ